MKKIHALDRHTINKIAAGEVVDRPRSVVKELVENALDAGADKIMVSVSSSPVDFIEVADNGTGIPYDEIPLAFRRHATSKIKSIHDLEHLSSLGFRGEALPSIASVSRCSLVTRSCNEEHGGRIEIVGGKQMLWQAAGRDTGTTVRVENLFFNVPARRKFLKTSPYEFRLIREFMETTALLTSANGVELILRREGETILHVGREENLFQRIEALFGEGVSRALVPVERQSGSVSV
ncbi:MAG TPA: DNA mismatch repair protein MutL, partial [Firmicutes bacterium]|nr:DNA mismatch repair protein MutL [Bacillota bacterium]